MNEPQHSNNQTISNDVDLTKKKILGVYPQKQEGLFMQRIKIFAGQITWRQFETIAQLAKTYSPDTPIHLTTRQDIELHNIRGEDLSAVHAILTEACLPTFATGGDSVRNITSCSGCGLKNDGIDLIPLAQLVQSYLSQDEIIFNLPRKFKISFSGCQSACARPWINDLAFVALPNLNLKVIGAGSLGPQPAAGIELYNDLEPKDVLPLCLAALDLFSEHGDRENRRKARLRHVRQKLGDEAFEKELDDRFQKIKKQKAWPQINLQKNKTGLKRLHRLQLPNGNISSDQAIELCAIAAGKNTILRLNLEHALEIYGTEPLELTEQLRDFENKPVIIACPGSTTCTRGITDCWKLADDIRKYLEGKPASSAYICISGCPNNCAQSSIADIGLVGVVKKADGESAEHFRIYLGGGNGKNPQIGELTETLPAKDIPQKVAQLLKEFE